MAVLQDKVWLIKHQKIDDELPLAFASYVKLCKRTNSLPQTL